MPVLCFSLQSKHHTGKDDDHFVSLGLSLFDEQCESKTCALKGHKRLSFHISDSPLPLRAPTGALADDLLSQILGSALTVVRLVPVHVPFADAHGTHLEPLLRFEILCFFLQSKHRTGNRDDLTYSPVSSHLSGVRASNTCRGAISPYELQHGVLRVEPVPDDCEPKLS
jgi:hypothetical protein